MSYNEYLSVLVPDERGKNVRHALRFPPTGTEDDMKKPMSLACNNDEIIWGRSRQVVRGEELQCDMCRFLVGIGNMPKSWK